MPTAQGTVTLDKAQIEDAFKSFLPLPFVLDEPFEEALRHVLDSPGSLVRPRMVFQVATAYGVDEIPAKAVSRNNIYNYALMLGWIV